MGGDWSAAFERRAWLRALAPSTRRARDTPIANNLNFHETSVMTMALRRAIMATEDRPP
jgi:hypothetical protein